MRTGLARDDSHGGKAAVAISAREVNKAEALQISESSQTTCLLLLAPTQSPRLMIDVYLWAFLCKGYSSRTQMHEILGRFSTLAFSTVVDSS